MQMTLTQNDILRMTEGQRQLFFLGVQMEKERIIKLFEESDSACSGWAEALIKGEPKFTTTRQKQLYDLATRVENRINGETNEFN